MMRIGGAGLLVMLTTGSTFSGAGVELLVPRDCRPAGYSRSRLDSVKSARFEIGDAPERNRLALALVDCIGDPDPTLRDGIVYEALSTWMRGGLLDTATVRALGGRLRPMILAPDDSEGFRKPFAALVLSEVARADRIKPALSTSERDGVIDAAITYMGEIKDYRAYDPVEGYRHGVAHGADLVLQLAVNPAVPASGVERLMTALARQISPDSDVIYSYGEPERLARAVYFAHRRNVVGEAFWDAWFAALVPAPSATAQLPMAQQVVVRARRHHNTIAFLHAASFAGRVGEDEVGARLAKLADREVRRMMGG